MCYCSWIFILLGKFFVNFRFWVCVNPGVYRLINVWYVAEQILLLCIAPSISENYTHIGNFSGKINREISYQGNSDSRFPYFSVRGFCIIWVQNLIKSNFAMSEFKVSGWTTLGVIGHQVQRIMSILLYFGAFGNCF